LFTQNWVSTVFAKNATPNPFARASGKGVISLNCSSPWPPPRITERGSANGDCDHVGLFSNISSKKVYWWHFAHCRSSFQLQYIDFECKNLVSRFGQEKLWSACASMLIKVIIIIIMGWCKQFSFYCPLVQILFFSVLCVHIYIY